MFQVNSVMNMDASPALVSSIKKIDTTKYSWSNIDTSPLSMLRRAAVLVPIVIRDGEIYVWLTLRSEKVSHDRGHVSFPGGMKDEGDKTEVDTCLRESEEEIGLERKDVKILAQLYPRINARHILITPVIGVISGDFIPNSNEEVEITFELPLRRFLSSEGHHSTPYSMRGIDILIHYFTNDIEGKEIQTWGLTATICIELAVYIYGEAPEYQYETNDFKMSIEDPFRHQDDYIDFFIRKYIEEQAELTRQTESKL